MKILLALLLAIMSATTPINTNIPVDSTVDPVFKQFALSSKMELSLENIPTSGWKEMKFPHELFEMAKTAGKQFHCAYYKGTINFDGEDLVFLHFESVNFLAKLWVNGKPAGTHLGGYLPFEFDITGLLNIGENKILLGTQDVTACVKPGVSIPEMFHKRSIPDASVICPIGSAYALSGLWLPSKIVKKPKTFVSNVWIKTSVKEQTIAVRMDVISKSETDDEYFSKILIETLDGKPVLEIGEDSIEITRNAGMIELSKKWHNPKLWSPENPKLYNAVFILKDGDTEIDRKVERFGFREFEIKGPDFYLNGTKIHLRACSKHMWRPGRITAPIDIYASDILNEVKSLNANTLRLHANPYPEVFLNLADEMGLFIINESSAWTMGRNYDLESDIFWANLKSAWNDHIERDYNHPSWIISSVENELQLTGGTRYEGVDERLAEIGEHVREMAGRPVMFEGDNDPEGSSDIINLHYSFEPTAHHTYPQDAFFLDGEFHCQIYPGIDFRWNRDKPLYMGEFLWLPEPLHAGAVVLGDSFYEDIEIGRLMSKVKFFDYYVSAFRMQGVSAMNPWNPLEDKRNGETAVQDITRELFKPVRFFVLQRDLHHFSGNNLSRTVTIQNWSETAKRIEFSWGFGEKTDSWSGILNPSENKIIDINIAIPKVDTKQTIPLEMSLISNNETVHEEIHQIQVYPKNFTAPEFILVDSKSTFSDSLKNLGFNFERVNNLEEISDENTSNLPLIIAPNSITKSDNLLEFVEDKNRKCLVLYPQENSKITYLQTVGNQVQERGRHQDGFTMTSWATDLGIFKADEMMTFFAGDNIIALDAFKMNKGTPMKPILSADSGWEQFYPIVELPQIGIFSTLAIPQKIMSEPRCSVILTELLHKLNEKSSDFIPLISNESGIHKLRILGFKTNEKTSEKSVIYLDSLRDNFKINLEDYHKDSVIILDRLPKKIIQNLGIEIEYTRTSSRISGKIPMDKTIFPSLTRGMIVSATGYQNNLRKNFQPPSNMVISKIEADDYEIKWILKNCLVLLESENLPDLIINILNWDKNWNHPLATILLELGVKPDPDTTLDFIFDKTTNNVRLDKNGVNFFSNGTATGTFTVDKDSRMMLMFSAKQQKAGDEPAQLEISIDDKKVDTLQAESEEFQIRAVRFDVGRGEHKITFSFVNDYFSETSGDRNLYVRSPVLLVISE